jgi:hypothetical protein
MNIKIEVGSIGPICPLILTVCPAGILRGTVVVRLTGKLAATAVTDAKSNTQAGTVLGSSAFWQVIVKLYRPFPAH